MWPTFTLARRSFFTNHAVVDRMAGRVELAVEMEARAERERNLEAVERQLAQTHGS